MYKRTIYVIYVASNKCSFTVVLLNHSSSKSKLTYHYIMKLSILTQVKEIYYYLPVDEICQRFQQFLS